MTPTPTRFPVLRHCAALLCGSITALASAHAAASAPTPAPDTHAQIELIKAGAITVDGKLTETLYNTGLWNSDFTVTRTTEKAKNQTSFRLFTDAETLYFVARMQKDRSEFHSGGAERDSIQLGSGDNINLFIRANADASEFMQFQITPNGALADIRLQQGGVTKEYSWNTDATAASHIDPYTGDWTVEMSVPLAALQIDPAEATWHVNVGRLTVRQQSKDGLPREFNSWIASPTEIDNANCLVAVSLPDFDRSVFGWRLQKEETKVVLKGGEAYLSTGLTLTNNTGAERSLQLHSSLQDNDSAQAVQEVKLAAAESRKLEALTPLGEIREGSGLLRLSVTGADSSNLWAIDTEQIAFAYAPARLQLTAPGYRATIFATQHLETLRAELIRLDDYAEIADIEAKLVLAEGQSLPATVTPLPTAGRWEITVADIAAVADGNYSLQVSFTSHEKDSAEPPLAQSLSRDVRKVPYQPGEVWIDAAGVVYRDGKPFPAYGFHYGRRDTTGQIQALLPDMFYNTYLPVWAEPPFTRMKQSIDNLAAIGIYSVVNVTSANKNGTRRNPADELTLDERIGFRRLAIAARNNPNVVGYYLADEPELIGHSPRRLQQIYDILREFDPYHPVVVTNNTDEGVRNYQYGSDIVNPDPYPIFLEGVGPARHFSRIATHIGNVSLGQESFRALWVTPQAFDLGPFRPAETGYRAPTATEMRAQQTVALINGTVGITWYTEEVVWDEPSIASSVPYLSQEYLWLYPHIVAARPQLLKTPTTVAASVSATKDGPVLMIVNLETSVTDITLNAPEFAAVRNWHAIGTERVVRGGAAKLHLSLQPHETLILAADTLALPDKLQPWAQVLSEEKRLAANVQTSADNIALNRNGAVSRALGGRAWNAYLATNGIKDLRALSFYLPFFKKGMGLEVSFPEPKTPRRVVLTGSNILTGTIEVQSLQDPERWITVARINNSSVIDEQTFTLNPVMQTRRIRVVGESVGPMAVDGIRIVQIEVYEK